MFYLLTASIIWSFSFGLIKGNLTGIDSNLVSFLRISLSFLIFLPFIKKKNMELSLIIRLIITGAIQYGFMYITYIYAYKFLKGYEVALFTVFTPLYITLINDIRKKKFHPGHLIVSILAFAGTTIIIYEGVSSPNILKGFFLIQLSNIFFAWGQVSYRDIMRSAKNIKDINVFAFLYFGALIVTFASALITVEVSNISITLKEAMTLLYLGTVSSGIAFFFWNYGVRRAMIGTIAIFNNLKIPLAIIVSLLVFREEGNILKIIAGGSILAIAILYNETVLKKRL